MDVDASELRKAMLAVIEQLPEDALSFVADLGECWNCPSCFQSLCDEPYMTCEFTWLRVAKKINERKESKNE